MSEQPGEQGAPASRYEDSSAGGGITQPSRAVDHLYPTSVLKDAHRDHPHELLRPVSNSPPTPLPAPRLRANLKYAVTCSKRIRSRSDEDPRDYETIKGLEKITQ